MLVGKENAKGMLCMMLHAHLPFVRHPEFEDFLEEDWLYEAITETYVPILDMMNGLLRDGVDFRLTMSMTPPLTAMLRDPLLQRRYVRNIEKLIELAESEVDRTWHHHREFHDAAQMYLRKFRRCREVFCDQYGGDLTRGFRAVMETGKLEIITCGATHGFFPLMQTVPGAIRAQLSVATESHRQIFGRSPAGIWNAECGYFPGLDQFLAKEGIRFFFADTHAILNATQRPVYGVFAPLFCPAGVAAFGRDVESSKSVWSSEEGYPGDPNYREFYRDIGFDLDLDYIRPYIHETGFRKNTGVKYYRITGKTVHKSPYVERWAHERAAMHAGNFMNNRRNQVAHLRSLMDRPPVVVSPYDAELFGHWWYEGPDFLNYLFRQVHFDQNDLDLCTPSEYLDKYPTNQVAYPSMSSWGANGYCSVWLEDSNDWIYRHLIKIAERMCELANERRHETNPLVIRALNQAAREVLLAQSSDWAFIMKTRTMVEYAVKRTKEHVAWFNELYYQIREHRVDEGFVHYLEGKNNIFGFIDFKSYADPQ